MGKSLKAISRDRSFIAFEVLAEILRIIVHYDRTSIYFLSLQYLRQCTEQNFDRLKR